MRNNHRQSPDFSAVRGKHLLIALSGGADSVALTCMLAESASALALRLTAAHMDHGIRPESAEDARFCAELCERLDIPLHLTRVDVPAEAKRTGEGLETVARNLRYGWLSQIQTEVGADFIVLAHHMDDQAETVLMHLARGTGPEGIGGMAELSGCLYRPLLGLRKRELVQWLEARGVQWREDATNAVADTPRNALRLHGIPELEKSCAQFVPAVARYAESARLESAFVAEQTEVWLGDHLKRGPYGLAILLSAPPHPALLRRAIRTICGAALSHDKLLEIEALTNATHGKLEVNKILIAEKTGRRLYFLPKTAAAIPEIPLSLCGESMLPGVCRVFAECSPPVPERRDPWVQVLNRNALDGAVLRIRRPGDRFRPLGCGDRLLSDFLTDRKLDRPLRDVTPLIARGNRVLWVCGLGISEDVRLGSPTDDAVRLVCRLLFEM